MIWAFGNKSRRTKAGITGGGINAEAAVLGWGLQTEMKGHELGCRTYVPIPQLSESQQRVWTRIKESINSIFAQEKGDMVGHPALMMWTGFASHAVLPVTAQNCDFKSWFWP